MKKQENWGRRAAVWMAAWSLLVTGCGASESPAQADGTGGGTGREAPIRAESTMDTVHSVQEEAAAPTDREGNAHPAESGGEQTEGFLAMADAFVQEKIQAVSLKELPEKAGEEGIVSLGKSPEGLFEMYGYYAPEGRYEGILLRDLFGNTSYFPDIAYTSRELVPPRMLWDPEEDILLASFHTHTENGESADDLWAFMRWETGHLEAVPFDREECQKRLGERLSYEVKKEENTVTFFDQGSAAGTFSLEGFDGGQMAEADYTGRLTFLAGVSTFMEFVPGLSAEGMSGFWYPEKGSLLAQISAERTGESGNETVDFTIEAIEGTETESDDPNEGEPGSQSRDGAFSFADLDGLSFCFSGGAGAWDTTLSIRPDGSFSGEYIDSDMGNRDTAYPGGTVYQCRFEGQLSSPVRVNDYTYRVEIRNMEYEKEEGTEEIQNGVRYEYTAAAGLESTESLLIYLPGAPWDALPQRFQVWAAYEGFSKEAGSILPSYGLYNEARGHGFLSAPVS